MQIELKDVRSLCDSHSILLKPLTLLVGENSTGKTTFLAMVAHVNQPDFPSTRPTFNIPPFDLGTYDSIATYKGGRYGRADSFSVGFTDDDQGKERSILATYSNHRGQPQVSEIKAIGHSGEMSVRILHESHTAHIAMKYQNREEAEFDVDLKQLGTSEADVPFFYIARMAAVEPRKKEGATLRPESYHEMTRLLRWTSNPVLALAPVRTRPSRTYDEFSEEFDPEGDHVPVLLARLWQEEAEAGRAALVAALNEFGESSALFKRIGVRHLGRRPTDPFQILVTTAGPPVNIPDVGYGVSQALPILVQSVLAAKRGMLLLQQPEVHLHPRAQAELGSFFARLVAKEGKHLIIETHSDYLLDRVRLEVAQQRLSVNDVQILFFEKQGIETTIHEIQLDKHGNVVGAPSSYRRFFLQEEENLFSRTQK
jgi:energy-coupling factor transporter ATP-binding protein EcfA2